MQSIPPLNNIATLQSFEVFCKKTYKLKNNHDYIKSFSLGKNIIYTNYIVFITLLQSSLHRTLQNVDHLQTQLLPSALFQVLFKRFKRGITSVEIKIFVNVTSAYLFLDIWVYYCGNGIYMQKIQLCTEK